MGRGGRRSGLFSATSPIEVNTVVEINDIISHHLIYDAKLLAYFLLLQLSVK